MILLLLAAMTTLFACNKDDDGGVDPNDPEAMRTIKLSAKVYRDEDVVFKFRCEDYGWYGFSKPIPFPTDLFIAWGDGSITSSDSHRYSNSGTYNITIQAKNLKWFEYSSRKIFAIDLQDCNSLEGIRLCGADSTVLLDFSGFKVLEYLDCSGSELKSLDLTGCSSLRELDCSGNWLRSLNLTGCSSLKELDCSNNDQKSLDLTSCSSLKTLNCSYNYRLNSLNIKGCSLLRELDCRYSDLSAEALNKIFNDLPQGISSGYSKIEIYGNPGSNTCDKSIAEKKGWEISMR